MGEEREKRGERESGVVKRGEEEGKEGGQVGRGMERGEVVVAGADGVLDTCVCSYAPDACN